MLLCSLFPPRIIFIALFEYSFSPTVALGQAIPVSCIMESLVRIL